MYKDLKPLTLARFEPTIFCFACGDNGYYTTPPGLKASFLYTSIKNDVGYELVFENRTKRQLEHFLSLQKLSVRTFFVTTKVATSKFFSLNISE
jgi:hypothetical protein